MFDVVVVGSVNYDLTVLTDHHPRPGETVLGTGHSTGAGGKGANQAVAAARFGARVAMLGRVGDDDIGLSLVEGLRTEGIDVTGVGIEPGTRSGLAVITLDREGENTIVVSPGANAMLTVSDVLAGARLRETRLVLTQLEIPLETVMAAARETAGVFCLNAAPARALPSELLEQVDILLVNRTELATLTGVMADTIDGIGSTARLIHGPTIVVTLGAEGALIVDSDGMSHVEAPLVDPLDTTGAGDAFCGVLAAALAEGMTLGEAARLAVTAGALATTRAGAMTAMPRRDEIEALVTRD
ncbi:MAG: ribokinase [Actinobacteria bacterium]|nr:ribokinase [Actinomycetota bacterium]